jgi:hypothetical protein
MTATLSREHIALRKLWWVGLLAIVSAILANLIVRAIAVASFSISGTLEVFAYPPEASTPFRGDMQKPPKSAHPWAVAHFGGLVPACSCRESQPRLTCHLSKDFAVLRQAE